MIHIRVKELLDKKYSHADSVNFSEVQRDTGLNYITVMKWYKETPTRVDLPTLEVWCHYFGCGLCDLLVLEMESGIVPTGRRKTKRA